MCKFATKKACDDAYADWQAMQQVILAHKVYEGGRLRAFRGDKSVFAQLVRMFAGEQEAIIAGDGEASRASFTRRIMDAYSRYRAEGPGPGRHLYQPPDGGTLNAGS